MSKQQDESGRLLAGAAAALLLGLACSSASAADMKDPASDPSVENITVPALAEVTDVKLKDSNESSSAKEDDSIPVDDLPETAVRLPGVSEEEQPRFRRQMYRTDI